MLTTQNKCFFYLCLLSLTTCPHPLFAQSSALALPPRITGTGIAGTFVMGRLDTMLPLQGNTHHQFYLNPTIAYGSDDQGYIDLGFGYRWNQQNKVILGGYLFTGYNRAQEKAQIWMINPGLEAFGSRWDMHLNGYFPLHERNKSLGYWLGYQVGRKNLQFQGHHAFDDLYYITQHIGHGVDLKYGYQLFPNIPLKASLGSYFFSPSRTSHIWGGAVGLEYWLDQHIKLIGGYTYDPYRKSIASLGLGIEFGGLRTQRTHPSVAERITDPVERGLAQQGQGTAIIARNTHFNFGPYPLNDRQLDDEDNPNPPNPGPNPGDPDLTPPPPPPPPDPAELAFFSQDGTPNNGGVGLTINNCTYENPCGPTDLSQIGIDTLNVLDPDTRMFFNGGDYPALNGTSSLILRQGQGLYSRTADYINPAFGDERSTFIGSFRLSGDNDLNNILMQKSAIAPADQLSAVLVEGSPFSIVNSQIGAQDNPIVKAISVVLPSAETGNSAYFIEGRIESSQAYGAGNTLYVKVPSDLNIEDSLFFVVDSLEINTSLINVATLFSVTDPLFSGANPSFITISNCDIESKPEFGLSGNYFGPVYSGGFNGGVLSIENSRLQLNIAPGTGFPTNFPFGIIYNGSGNGTRMNVFVQDTNISLTVPGGLPNPTIFYNLFPSPAGTGTVTQGAGVVCNINGVPGC